MFQKVFEWIKLHPLYAVLIVLAVILLVFVTANGLGRSIEIWRERKVDARIAAKDKEATQLKTERDAAIARANIAEAQAVLLASENKARKDLINAKGGAIEAAQKELEKRIEDAKANAGSCANDPDPRGCTCKKLQSAGFDCR